MRISRAGRQSSPGLDPFLAAISRSLSHPPGCRKTSRPNSGPPTLSAPSSYAACGPDSRGAALTPTPGLPAIGAAGGASYKRVKVRLLVVVEDARATQLLDGVLHGRCVRSVARTFSRVLDAKTEGGRRHVPSPTEAFQRPSKGWPDRQLLRDGTGRGRRLRAVGAVVIGGERHHQVANVLQPLLF